MGPAHMQNIICLSRPGALEELTCCGRCNISKSQRVEVWIKSCYLHNTSIELHTKYFSRIFSASNRIYIRMQVFILFMYDFCFLCNCYYVRLDVNKWTWFNVLFIDWECMNNCSRFKENTHVKNVSCNKRIVRSMHEKSCLVSIETHKIVCFLFD